MKANKKRGRKRGGNREEGGGQSNDKNAQETNGCKITSNHRT